MAAKTEADVFNLPVSTAAGVFSARFSEKGLCALQFPTNPKRGHEEPEASSVPEHIRHWHSVTTKALGRVLEGHQPSNLPPLDVSVGTEFQQRVWTVMRQIPHGR